MVRPHLRAKQLVVAHEKELCTTTNTTIAATYQPWAAACTCWDQGHPYAPSSRQASCDAGGRRQDPSCRLEAVPAPCLEAYPCMAACHQLGSAFVRIALAFIPHLT